MHAALHSENVKGRDQLRYVRIDWRIILKWTLK